MDALSSDISPRAVRISVGGVREGVCEIKPTTSTSTYHRTIDYLTNGRAGLRMLLGPEIAAPPG
jgi:hypothetical protein